MDEADLLGDRIAIMAGGTLQCCGSSFFLKKKYGAGYHLIMDKTQQCDVNQVTNLLQKYIPNVQVETNIGSELSYLLPDDSSSLFERMLSELEIYSHGFGILSYGISLTTLEEVFMKVGADHGQDDESYLNEGRNAGGAAANGYLEVSQVDPHRTDALQALNQNLVNQHAVDTTLELEENLSTGCTLWCNQFLAMLMKRGLSIFRSWILFIIQNFIPVLFLILAIVLAGGTNSFRDLPDLKMELASYDDPVTVVTQNGGSTSKYAERYKGIVSSRNSIIDWEGSDMVLKMLNETLKNTAAVRNKYIVGATFDESITAWFNNQPYHSPSLALQLVMNAILQEEVSPEYSIQIHNFPVPFTLNTKLTQLDQGKTVGFQIAFNLGFSMAFASAFYVMFYIRERICKAKHLQFVSGISVIPFWLASFICDFLTFLFTALLIIITMAILQEDGFRTVGDLGRVFSILLYFGFSMLPMMYLASYMYDIPSTGFTRMTMLNIFTGVASMLIVQILSQPELELQRTADILHWILLLVPHYSFSAGLRDMYVTYSTHSLCEMAVDRCIDMIPAGIPNLSPDICKALICQLRSQCCSSSTDYYSMKTPGIGRNVIFSVCVGIVLICILLGIEFRLFEKVSNKICGRQRTAPQATKETEIDSDVLQEKIKIRNASMEEIGSMSLVMRDVTKYYEQFLAVNSICLGVNRYECFGLLGVNGAGKTTTFKMMTGDIKMSSGEAWVKGLSLKTDMKQVHQLIGYCPQFDALLDDLTCRETLIIFSLLRGISLDESKVAVVNLSQELDFHRHLDKKVKELSGGNKRKLSTAVALIGNPLVVYLDEPTAGMDPATKRYLWNALCKVRDSGKCIVLTSHSMEECEALCTRLAIMVNGTFMCLGSTQHLKSKFSEGYTLTIKVRKTGTGELESSEWEPVERFVKENFPGATIRERHQELLTFYIANKTLPWSRMFGILENGKLSLNIEDYSLGQSTLEQVFLSFTKYQREDESA